MADKGTCELHGEFSLLDGCPQCLAAKRGDWTNPVWEEEKAVALVQDEVELEMPREIMPTETALIRIKPDADQSVISLYSEAVKLQRYAVARVILTNDDLKPATEDLSIIAGLRKAFEEIRTEYIKPIRIHIDAINETFKQFTAPLVEADTLNRDKVKAYQAEQNRKRLEAEALEREKLELARREMLLKGEFTIDLSPIPIPEVIDKVHTDLGTAASFKVRKWEIENFSLIPDALKLIDAGKVTKLVKAGIGSIAGIRIWEEDSIRVTPQKRG